MADTLVPVLVTTAEELNALPGGSLVVSDDQVYRRLHHGAGEDTFACLTEAQGHYEYATCRASTVLWQTVPPSAAVVYRPDV